MINAFTSLRELASARLIVLRMRPVNSSTISSEAAKNKIHQETTLTILAQLTLIARPIKSATLEHATQFQTTLPHVLRILNVMLVSGVAVIASLFLKVNAFSLETAQKESSATPDTATSGYAS